MTRATHPHLWTTPSALVRIQGDEEVVTVCTGALWELLSWEKKWTGDRTLRLNGIEFHVDSGTDPLAVSTGPNALVEAEIMLDSDDQLHVHLPLLADLVPVGVITGALMLPPVTALTVNANRDVEWVNDGDVRVIDIPVNTLPSTRLRQVPRIWCSRWLRVISWESGYLAIWFPPVGDWREESVRWPHTGVPSITWPMAEVASQPEALARFLSDVAAHEVYFAKTWLTEFEGWETELFDSFVKAGEAGAATKLAALQAELGQFSNYLDSARHAQRCYERRQQTSALVRNDPAIAGIFEKTAAELSDLVRLGREAMRGGFELLNSTMQAYQAYEAQRSREASERLNDLLSQATAIFFVPTMVATVYGTNVRELSPGAGGSLPNLGLLMAGASCLSLGLIREFIRHLPRRGTWLLVLAGITLASLAFMT